MAMHRVAQRVRIVFDVGGPNLTSSFRMIGQIFDCVAPHGSVTSDPVRNVQTVTVPPGGATMVEFLPKVPGAYVLVDHALSRVSKSAVGQLVVEGPDNPDLFQASDLARVSR